MRDGDATAVREEALGAMVGAAALVYVLAGEPTEDDERRCVRPTSRAYRCSSSAPSRPQGFPTRSRRTCFRPTRRGVPARGARPPVGAKDENAAVALAARLPALRRGVADALVARVARQNAAIAAAVFIPGVDFPVLTLNQLRLVLRIAAAYGEEIDAERLPEILGVVGTALGFRALARQAVASSRSPAGPCRAAVAYAGTRTLGEVGSATSRLGP